MQYHTSNADIRSQIYEFLFDGNSNVCPISHHKVVNIQFNSIFNSKFIADQNKEQKIQQVA